jgi:hypothetical protein
MTARHWMQIAALTAALGLTGAAIAQNTEGTTSTDDRASTRSSSDTPSAGAIVTPEDKALGMGQKKQRHGEGNERASPPNDDELSVNPGASRDAAMSVNPGPSSDDESSIKPGPSDDDELRVNPGSSKGEDLPAPK